MPIPIKQAPRFPNLDSSRCAQDPGRGPGEGIFELTPQSVTETRKSPRDHSFPTLPCLPLAPHSERISALGFCPHHPQAFGFFKTTAESHADGR